MNRIVVAGAGAWGGWIALHLLRRGHQVTLVDPWGPGNPRASSGDESRIVRANYGASAHYVPMAVRALEFWREFESAHGVELIRRCGFLWMERHRDVACRASIAPMREAGVAFEELSPNQLRARFPQISFEGIEFGVLELAAGYAFARRACRAVAAVFEQEGGRLVRDAVQPISTDATSLASMPLQKGVVLEADAFVAACGPWLPQVVPDIFSQLLRPTRQELFYFGEPAAGPGFGDDVLPAWVDHGDELWYGSPGNEGRGFKVGDDTRGPAVDPTTQDRVPSANMVAKTRAYAAERFPALAGAPIVESRVCQYENSPDNDFIIDRHPQIDNLWLAGGGSGHGFKHAPAIGELVARIISDGVPPPRMFSLGRFDGSTKLA